MSKIEIQIYIQCLTTASTFSTYSKRMFLNAAFCFIPLSILLFFFYSELDNICVSTSLLRIGDSYFSCCFNSIFRSQRQRDARSTASICMLWIGRHNYACFFAMYPNICGEYTFIKKIFVLYIWYLARESLLVIITLSLHFL